MAEDKAEDDPPETEDSGQDRPRPALTGWFSAGQPFGSDVIARNKRRGFKRQRLVLCLLGSGLRHCQHEDLCRLDGLACAEPARRHWRQRPKSSLTGPAITR